MKLQGPENTTDQEPIVLEVADEELTTELEVSTPGRDKSKTALGVLPDVDNPTRLIIRKTAKGFVKDLSKFTPQSPEYVAKIREINTLAYNESQATTSATTGMLSRASTSLVNSKRSGNETSFKVASSLAELRTMVDELNPNQSGKGLQAIIRKLPFGNKMNQHLQRYESSRDQLDAIIESLEDGRTSLITDNAELSEEKARQWENMLQLRDYIYLAEELVNEIKLAVDELRAAGNEEAAHALEADALFAANQRYQDLTVQATVATQGYMAMELIRQNNNELIKGVERTQTTTMTALETSVIIATALAQQKRIIDQVDATNESTNSLIVATGKALRTQTARIQEQASSSGVSIEALQQAQGDIIATITAIDTFKVKANAQMEVTIGNITKQLAVARPHLDRVQAIESAESGANSLETSTRKAIGAVKDSGKE